MTREQEFAQLPALPIVPWAVTLAMTVAYRQFRETSLTVRRCRSKSDWQSACATLGTLSDQWWTAEAMAKLGTKAVAAFEGISRRKYYWKEILAARNLNLTSSDVISHQQQGQSRVLPDSEVATASSVRSIDREGSQDVRALAFYDNREEHSTYLQSDGTYQYTATAQTFRLTYYSINRQRRSKPKLGQPHSNAISDASSRFTRF
jgi:hypothetical protein